MDKQLLRDTLINYLKDRNIELIELTVSQDNVISVELDSYEGVDLDTCVEVTRMIESRFDREVEDYELEVGSVSLTDPFRTPMQYKKHVGHEVSVLTADGRKLTGLLVDADELKFMVDVELMVREEGAKRRKKKIETMSFAYDEVKSVKYLLKF